mgnify:CR=1 FL=1
MKYTGMPWDIWTLITPLFRERCREEGTVRSFRCRHSGYRFDTSFLSPHYGPSGATRTPGLLIPNLSGILFPLVYSGFRHFLICFTYSLTLLSPLFPGVPAPSVVIYVVKNASRPVSGELSPVPDGKRFAFQIICIVTLGRVLCKWFLRGGGSEAAAL